MNTINSRKTLAVFPEIDELEYGSNISTSKLNTQLNSIEESALRALLRSREITSELTRIQLGVIKSYQAMGQFYEALNFEEADKAYASSFSIVNNLTSSSDILYDSSYGLVTLNPIGSYSKIPRGIKYDGKVAPQVTMYLDDVEIDKNSEAYDSMDGTNKYFWIQEVTPNSQHEVRIDLPPSLTKRFNYIELFPFPLYGMSIKKVEYVDFRSTRWDVTRDIYGTMNPLQSNNGEAIKLYLAPKEFNGTIYITVEATTLGVIGFSNIDIKFNDFDNTTKGGYLRFDSFDVMVKPLDVTLSSVSLDYYFDGPKAQSLVTSNESPIEVVLQAGKILNGEINQTNAWQHRLDLADAASYVLNDVNFTLEEDETIFLQFNLKEHNVTTPVIRGAKLVYTSTPG